MEVGSAVYTTVVVLVHMIYISTVTSSSKDCRTTINSHTLSDVMYTSYDITMMSYKVISTACSWS